MPFSIMTMHLACQVTIVLELLASARQVSAAPHLKNGRMVTKRADGDLEKPACANGFEPGEYKFDWVGDQGAPNALRMNETREPVFWSPREEVHPAPIIQWAPPLQMTLSAQAEGLPGIVNSVAFTPDLREKLIPAMSDYRIDLEIIPGQFHVPLWGQGGKHVNATTDARVVPENGAVKNETFTLDRYAFYYPDYKPTEMVEYKLDWQPDSVTWSVGGAPRVKITNIKGNGLSQGPLALRFGIWADWWVGQADWQAHPRPTFNLGKVVIQGCKQSIAP